MELCTGGSLFNILDDPENTYGLQENEFLLVVEHLSAGKFLTFIAIYSYLYLTKVYIYTFIL